MLSAIFKLRCKWTAYPLTGAKTSGYLSFLQHVQSSSRLGDNLHSTLCASDSHCGFSHFLTMTSSFPSSFKPGKDKVRKTARAPDSKATFSKNRWFYIIVVCKLACQLETLSTWDKSRNVRKHNQHWFLLVPSLCCLVQPRALQKAQTPSLSSGCVQGAGWLHGLQIVCQNEIEEISGCGIVLKFIWKQIGNVDSSHTAKLRVSHFQFFLFHSVLSSAWEHRREKERVEK